MMQRNRYQARIRPSVGAQVLIENRPWWRDDFRSAAMEAITEGGDPRILDVYRQDARQFYGSSPRSDQSVMAVLASMPRGELINLLDTYKMGAYRQLQREAGQYNVPVPTYLDMLEADMY